MGSVAFCRTCRRHHWDGHAHRCPPAYLAWCPDLDEDEDEAIALYAVEAEEAAEEWAERQDADSAEYGIVVGEPATVHVRAPDGTVTVWRVTGESVPSYSAEEVVDG